jgi:beta-glucanase (GH16 family)
MCIVPSVEDSLVTRINFNALNEDWATQDCGEEGYHTYEIEWTPTYISYHYDG